MLACSPLMHSGDSGQPSAAQIIIQNLSHKVFRGRVPTLFAWAYIIYFAFVQAEIYLFKEFAAKVERKVAENAALEEDYDDAPDEFKGK